MARKFKTPQIYFDTMGLAIDEGKERARKKGYIVADEPHDKNMWDAMSYETSQERSYILEKNNIVQKKYLHISLYRMHSGKYELVDYVL